MKCMRCRRLLSAGDDFVPVSRKYFLCERCVSQLLVSAKKAPRSTRWCAMHGQEETRRFVHIRIPFLLVFRRSVWVCTSGLSKLFRHLHRRV